MIALANALLLSLAAWSAEPADVVQTLGDGIQVNWTTLRLEIDATARSSQLASIRPVEELARREIGAIVRQSVGRVPLTTDLSLGQALASEQYGPALGARTSRWVVSKAVYGTSGRVWLQAELSLRDVFKPWLLDRAVPSMIPSVEPASMRTAGHGAAAPGDIELTGILIDARGLPFGPAYAPRIFGPSGALLFSGELGDVDAVTEPPFIFVSDPAHPATARLGDHPLVLVAASAHRSDLVLPAQGASRFTSALALQQRGGIVVVVDAP